jgi:hypothetical protein
MARKNWHCDLNCQLCFYQPEPAKHLLIDCNFAEVVWNSLGPQNNMPNYIDLSGQGLANWVRSLIFAGSKREKRRKLGFLFTFWWNLWKEQNRRIFQAKELSVLMWFL